MKTEILSGLHAIWENPALRALAVRGMAICLFFGFYATLYLLFALRELGMSVGTLGLVIAMGGVGSMTGALLSEPVARRFGTRTTFVVTSVVISATATLIPLAPATAWGGALFLGAAQLLGDCAAVIFITNELSFRQRVTPAERLGRVNAAMQMLSRGLLPVGALAAGAIAGSTGLRGAMGIAAAGIWLSNFWLLMPAGNERSS